MATNTNIKFEIKYYLNASPKTLSWIDTTNYGALGFLSANAEVILKITGPLGVMYQNTGWTNDNFASPDMVGLGTKSAIAIALDSNLDVPLGTYIFECKIKDTGGGTIYYSTKSYDYQYASPVADITQTVYLRTSQLKSEDATEYAVTEDDISPFSRILAHTIEKPASATGCNLPSTATTTDSVRLIGAGAAADEWIWTGAWVSSIVSDLIYKLEDWGSVAWIYVYDQVLGSDSITVTQDSCFLQYYSTFKNLIARYEAALRRGNTTELNSVNAVLEQVGYYWMEYELADRNGDTTEKDYWCGKLTELITLSGYTAVTTSDVSEAVIPWGSDTIVLTGTVFTFGNGAASPTGGNAGDYYFRLDSPVTYCELWYNNAGTWTYIADLKGATGAAGDNAVLLYSSVAIGTSGVTTGTGSDESLISYAMPANTLTVNGSGVGIEGSIELANDGVEKEVQLRIGNTASPGNRLIVGIVVADEVTAKTDIVLVDFKAYKKNSTTLVVKGIMSRSGSPSDSEVIYIELLSDCTAITNISICGKGAAGAVIAREMSVSNIQIQ